MSEGIESKMSDLKVDGQEPPKSTAESSTGKQKPKKQDKERKDQKVAHKSKPQQQAKKKQDGPELIGITEPKRGDLSEWYQQVILKAEMLAFTDIPGCYVYLPPSYRIWEFIQEYFNERIRKLGVKNAYFPLFISEDNLQREESHIEGFAAEVAWVTHGGKSKLEKRLAVRPTSETAMYDFYSKKIRSHRDLPLKLNQWNNVVRWEFKHAVPFLRSREFLWQEGHTAHLTEKDAGIEVMQILDWYADIYEHLLAVPVVKGQKTKNEQFPGAHYTKTIEGFIPAVGRGIQAATSHCLGQHFAKMFDIKVEDPDQQIKEGEKRDKLHVWQNSWGFTTRSIGVMVLVHGDDKGLVIPPRVAEVQVAIVPVGVTAKTTDADREKLYDEVHGLKTVLEEAGVRAEVDLREGYSPGWKFADWELKGTPLRLEYGPKDAANGVVTTSRRDTSEKGTIPVAELSSGVPKLLEQIQKDLFMKASDEYASHRKIVREWKDFVPTLNAKNVLLVAHCLGGDCEDEIKKDSAGNVEGQEVDARAPSMGAKSLCIPHDQPEPIAEGQKCINPKCDAAAQQWVMFGRSY
ncbi:Putative proline--tRNA ligase [Fulvia fulva]|uniref:proline--tRNA ligase n=1 Tax=Passalora fulva TaxID=5499 RepID=A0A9Q8PE19_PASFU|nr:Putative proline--tRNA ligase [Fulvia fulva]KAK4617963.1 putative proline--tRNA ligase [Fulvia fulva]KAK4618432.1 putative proline--tRNA ligase [Fulvia fulva]UJO20796.1 Putative proline--tRNA ligase [Fulvia fulva]WPV18251.1 Putative proline--tRNA ligase [Fulvia fulva]WPV32933.1 Putative proline--tRNA ligase [Fulvia fulva]